MQTRKYMTRKEARGAMFNEDIGLSIIAKLIPAALDGDMQAAQAFALLNIGRHLSAITDRLRDIRDIASETKDTLEAAYRDGWG